MFTISKQGCTILIKEGVTIPCNHAKSLLSLYHARLIPEGTIFTKREMQEFLSHLDPKLMQEVSNLFVIKKLDTAENMEILGKVMVSERERNYFKKKWERVNSPQNDLDPKGGIEYKLMERKWAYKDNNRPFLFINAKGEIERSSPNNIPPQSENKEENKEEPKADSSSSSPSTPTPGSEKKTEKRMDLSVESFILGLVSLGVTLAFGINSWIKENPESVASIKKEAREIAQKYNRDEEVREYLGIPPKTSMEKAVDYIKKEKESKERISRLQQMGGYDINAEIEKRNKKK